MGNVGRGLLFTAFAVVALQDVALGESRTEQANRAGIKAGPAAACTLMSKAEFAKITGRQPFDEPAGAQLANGGSSCEYEGGGFTLYSGPQSEAHYEALLKIFKADATPRQPVTGVGARAYVMLPKPRDQYQGEYAILVVRQGVHTLAVNLEAGRNEKANTLQPKLEALAKAALPRLP